MDVLVLSSTYEPINLINWQRALALVALNVVEELEWYDDWTVRSAHREHPVPSVIRILRKTFRWNKGVRFSRDNVYIRDNGRCQYCGNRVPKSEYTYDHVTPRKLGGATRWENIVVSCLPCNQKKGCRTLAEAKMHLQRMPERPKSLPGGLRLPLPKQIPESWKAYLRDLAYWHGSLDEE